NNGIRDRNVTGVHTFAIMIYDDFTIDFSDELFIDWDKVYILLNRLEKEFYESPANAKLDEHGQIIPEKLGTRLNRTKFISVFMKSLYGQTLKKITIPKENTFPKVDSEL